MAFVLRQSEPDFESRFSAFLATKREVSEDVDRAVADIIHRVRTEGDAALIDYSQRSIGSISSSTALRLPLPRSMRPWRLHL